jgi:hypothetical protein
VLSIVRTFYNRLAVFTSWLLHPLGKNASGDRCFHIERVVCHLLHNLDSDDLFKELFHGNRRTDLNYENSVDSRVEVELNKLGRSHPFCLKYAYQRKVSILKEQRERLGSLNASRYYILILSRLSLINLYY